MNGLDKARLLAVLVPAGLLAGAHGSQYLGGLTPCQLCYWQRWPHGAAHLLSFALARACPTRPQGLVWLAALAIPRAARSAPTMPASSRLFEGFTQCAASARLAGRHARPAMVRWTRCNGRSRHIDGGRNAILSTLVALVTYG